jgi:hypothetical protein
VTGAAVRALESVWLDWTIFRLFGICLHWAIVYNGQFFYCKCSQNF